MLISSKSNIEQSVGRILRKQHENIVPHIYDMVDNFSVFGNQGMKRMKFYQKNKYKIWTSRINDDCIESMDSLYQKSRQRLLKENTRIKKGVCLL